MVSGYQGANDHAVGFLFLQMLTSLGAIVGAGYLSRNRAPYLVLGMAVAGAALAAIVAIATFDVAAASGPLANLAAPSLDFGRATGPFSNPNYLGSFVAIMLV